MRIVVLYEELAEYTLACLRHLVKNKEVSVYVFKKKRNKEAPFDFDFSGLNVFEREKFSPDELKEKVCALNPNLVLCSGWMYKPYLRVCKALKQVCKRVLLLDNHWEGSLKQHVNTLMGKYYFSTVFSDAFVPGAPQRKYALKLGFKTQNIHEGFYCCDTSFFSNLYLKMSKEKQHSFPKRMIYLGRYVQHKGIGLLWEVFSELAKKPEFKDWELWCIGTGNVEPLKHSKIKHFGFIQPKELAGYLKDTGVFILPSFFEPWGVVVHEFAAAGFPLLLSDRVGAHTAFLKPGENGFLFKAEDKKSLTQAMQSMMLLNQDALLKMSAISHRQSKHISLDSWCKTIEKLAQ